MVEISNAFGYQKFARLAMPIIFYNADATHAFPEGFFENKMNVDLIRTGWGSFSQFLINCISNDYYVYFFIDQFYIPGSVPYQKKHFRHPTTVCGFDLNDRKFYIADFYNVHFGVITIDFDIFEDAMVNSLCPTNQPFEVGVQNGELVRCFKYINTKQLTDVNLIRKTLDDYLRARNETYGYKINKLDHNLGYSHGVEVYQVINDYLNLVIDEMENTLVPDKFRGHFEMKYLQFFYGHKLAMLMRIRYLGENGYLREWDTIYDNYQYIEQRFKVLRDMATRGFIARNPTIIKGIIKELPELKNKEIDILEKMLVNLEEQ